jgi:hypothetical protein
MIVPVIEPSTKRGRFYAFDCSRYLHSDCGVRQPVTVLSGLRHSLRPGELVGEASAHGANLSGNGCEA